jgi:hypothetical protein
VSLPWEAKALDGLELPDLGRVLITHSGKVQFLFKFIFRRKKSWRNSMLVAIKATKRAEIVD